MSHTNSPCGGNPATNAERVEVEMLSCCVSPAGSSTCWSQHSTQPRRGSGQKPSEVRLAEFKIVTFVGGLHSFIVLLLFWSSAVMVADSLCFVFNDRHLNLTPTEILWMRVFIFYFHYCTLQCKVGSGNGNVTHSYLMYSLYPPPDQSSQNKTLTLA